MSRDYRGNRIRYYGSDRISQSSNYKPIHNSRNYYHRRPKYRSYQNSLNESDSYEYLSTIILFIIAIAILPLIFISLTNGIVLIALLIVIVIIVRAAFWNEGETRRSPRRQGIYNYRRPYTLNVSSKNKNSRNQISKNNVNLNIQTINNQKNSINNVNYVNTNQNDFKSSKKLEERLISSYDVCPSCGSLVEQEDYFCINCGTKLK